MQDIKAKVKAVAAVATGALMVGATLAGSAMALDLGDLPAPFVEDNEWNCVGVLGTGGSSRSGLAEDLIASAQVLTSFAQHTVPIEESEATGLTGVAKITVSGATGKQDEIELFNDLSSAFGTNLDDRDLPMLDDMQYTTSGGQSIDIEETVTLGAGVGINQHEGELGIEIPSAALVYNFKIDDDLDDDGDGLLTCDDWNVDNATFDGAGEMDVELLGFDVTITCLTNGQVQLEGGTTAVLNLGEEITYTEGDDTWTIRLKAVDDNADKAYLQVTKGSSSTDKVIDVDEDDLVLGLEIKVESAFPSSGGADAFAEIKYGTELSDTLDEGEEWPYNEDYDVEFDETDTFKPILQLKYAPDTSVEDENAITEGQSWSSFNDAFDIMNKGLDVENTLTLTIEQKSDSLYDGMADTTAGSEESIHWAIDDELDLYNWTSTSQELYRDVWLVLDPNGGGDVIINSRDSDGSKYAVGQTDGVNYLENYVSGGDILLAHGTYGSTDLKFWWNNTGLGLIVDVDGQDNITLQTYQSGNSFIELSGADGDAVASDLVYNDSATISATVRDNAIGTEDYDFWTEYGVRVEEPQDNIESGDGKLVLEIPDDQQKMVVLVGKDEPTTVDLEAGESSGSCEIDEITVSGTIRQAGDIMPIAVDVAKLDTEIADATANNLIIFGGPTVNSLAADLGYTVSDFMDGSDMIGIVEMIENAFGGTNSALVIAGYDAANTRMAGWVAAHYPDYDLDGKTRVVVKGTTTESIEVA